MRSTAGLLRIGGIPHRPWCSSLAENLIQLLLFLESIHAAPKTIMRKGDQLLVLNQTVKGLLDQFLPVFHVAKNLAPKNEKSPVDPVPGFTNMVHALYDTVLIGLDQVKASPRSDTDKTGDFAGTLQCVNHPR